MKKYCPLCKNNVTQKLTDKLRFGHKADVLQCSECTLVYLDQSSFEFPEDFYQSQYHQTYLTHVDPEMLDPATHFKKMQQTSKIWVERINNMLKGDEVILDVGCSTGHMLMGVKDKAQAVYGHELSHKEIEFCREQLNLDVQDTPLEKRFAPESFDLITLIFVLEHIGGPVEFLKELKTYLKPNGRLVIVVPNIKDPLMAFYQIPKFKEFYYCIEHLFYYSPVTLDRVLDLAGFVGSSEPVQEYPITNHLNWAYKQKPSDTLSSRRLVPDVNIEDKNIMSEWELFWKEMDMHYRKYMTSIKYSDRIWSVSQVNI